MAGSGGCSDATDTYAVTVTGTIATVGTGNWDDPSSWGGSSVPTAGQDVTIIHDITVNTNTADLGNLTINSGNTLSVGAFTLEVSGTLDNDGTLSIGASSVVNADGTFDATGGNTTFTGAGTLKLGSTVTDLGTFTRSTGTVEYDGVNQSVAALNASSSASYYNLVINGSGTKTLAGSSSVYGDLTLTASDFDLAGNTIYPKNNITRSTGNLIAGSASNVTINNSGSHNICAFNDDDITLKTTNKGG